MVVLALLRDGGEMYGLELVKESKRRLTRGGVYVLLDRLEDKGFVTSRRRPAPEGEGGLPRRLYSLTGLGERALSAANLISPAPVRGRA